MGAALAAALGLGAVLVFARLFLGWIYSVPLCALAGESPRAALQKSRAIATGNRVRLGVVLGVWIAAASSGGIMVALILNGAGGFLLPRLGSSLNLLIPAISLFIVLFFLSTALFAFVGFSGYCLASTRSYHQLTESGAAALPAVEKKFKPVPFSAKWVWLAVVGGVAATIVVAFATVESIDVNPEVLVTAHRGSSHSAPENTLAAVRRAIEDGADYAEIDVQESADGEIVVIHDMDLMRIAGVPKKIWQMTAEEIQGLEAGSWFSEEFRGEPIPTLDQMILLAGDRIRLNIELKLNGHEQNLEERVIRIISKHNFQDRCLITSLSYPALAKTRELAPELKTGYIVLQALGDLSKVEADAFSLGSGLVNRRLAADIRQRGKEVHVWTINDPAKMRRFIDMGVDNIITDRPDLLVALIRERAKLSDTEKLLLVFSSRVWG